MTKLHMTADIDEKLLKKQIVREILKQINSSLSSMKNDGVLRSQLNDFVNRQIRNSPEFSSILSGELKSIFGLINPETVLTSVIDEIKKNIQIDISPAKVIGDTIVDSSITVSILRDNFQDVLSLEASSYESRGGEVKWLDWLLTKGDSIILADYTLKNDIFGADSRTDGTIMVKSNKGFRVPPEYAGNVHNNWLTRCFEETEEIVGNILKIEFVRRFS